MVPDLVQVACNARPQSHLTVAPRPGVVFPSVESESCRYTGIVLDFGKPMLNNEPELRCPKVPHARVQQLVANAQRQH